MITTIPSASLLFLLHCQISVTPFPVFAFASASASFNRLLASNHNDTIILKNGADLTLTPPTVVLYPNFLTGWGLASFTGPIQVLWSSTVLTLEFQGAGAPSTFLFGILII